MNCSQVRYQIPNQRKKSKKAEAKIGLALRINDVTYVIEAFVEIFEATIRWWCFRLIEGRTRPRVGFYIINCLLLLLPKVIL